MTAHPGVWGMNTGTSPAGSTFIIDGGERHMKQKLVMTVGLPRAGKTTWAREQNVPIVNPDAIRVALHGQAYAPDAEEHVWAIAKTMVKALFLAGHMVVILDATNGSVHRRDNWLNEAWERHFAVFDTTAAVCNQRAVETDRSDLIPVIDRMSRHWQDLSDEEGRVSKGYTADPTPMSINIRRWLRTA